jgi:hypothetical protein
MKKLILFLFAIVVLSAAFARVTTKVFKTPANIEVWGTPADTLIASVSDTAVMKITSDYVGKVNLLLFSDAVSGTPAYTAVLQGSINQASYVALDTITHSGGGDKLAYFAVQDLVYNYYRVIITASSAAQKSRLYIYGISRQ